MGEELVCVKALCDQIPFDFSDVLTSPDDPVFLPGRAAAIVRAGKGPVAGCHAAVMVDSLYRKDRVVDFALAAAAVGMSTILVAHPAQGGRCIIELAADTAQVPRNHNDNAASIYCTHGLVLTPEMMRDRDVLRRLGVSPTCGSSKSNSVGGSSNASTPSGSSTSNSGSSNTSRACRTSSSGSNSRDSSREGSNSSGSSDPNVVTSTTSSRNSSTSSITGCDASSPTTSNTGKGRKISPYIYRIFNAPTDPESPPGVAYIGQSHQLPRARCKMRWCSWSGMPRFMEREMSIEAGGNLAQEGLDLIVHLVETYGFSQHLRQLGTRRPNGTLVQCREIDPLSLTNWQSIGTYIVSLCRFSQTQRKYLPI